MTEIPQPPQPRPAPRSISYVLVALASIAVAVISTMVITDHFPRLQRGLDIREEIPRMQAVIDFESVSSWTMGCMGVGSYEVLPLWHQELLSYYKPENVKVDRLPPNVRGLYNEERAILILNRSLSFEREYYKAEAKDTYSFFETLTFISIGIGMLTTIFVSISSTELKRGKKTISIIAIILPIIGTAVSGIIGFYSPQSKWNQASHTLASLSQLHGQMAIGIWNLKCIEKPDDTAAKGAAKNMLEDWSKRHVDIQTVSTAAGSAAPAASGGAGAKKD